MAEYDRRYPAAVGTGAGARVGIDEGLRAFMLGIYNNMALGLALTGLVAYGASQMAIQDGQLTLVRRRRSTSAR